MRSPPPSPPDSLPAPEPPEGDREKGEPYILAAEAVLVLLSSRSRVVCSLIGMGEGWGGGGVWAGRERGREITVEPSNKGHFIWGKDFVPISEVK